MIGTMDQHRFNTYCSSLIATSHVVQWGGADVWKVAGKLFAVGGWNEGKTFAITFKTSPTSFDILKEQPGLRPAPYLASRGMKWIQHYDAPGLDDNGLKTYIAESHRLVAAGLSKKKQCEHGLLADD